MSGKICEDRKECGARSYNPETHFCGGIAGITIYEKCNGKTYSSPEKYVCCNGETYDIEKYRCVNGALGRPCGSSAYDPKTQYCSNGVVKNDRYGTLTYNGQTYKTVGIGTQNWMAENLNYDAEDSKCYNDLDNNCTKYGRLYNWATARTVCPSGWHLPSDAEWETLMDFVGVSDTGTKLKAESGWGPYNVFDGGTISYNGTDDYGFAALPGGVGRPFFCGEYDDKPVPSSGFWWTSSYTNQSLTYYIYAKISYSPLQLMTESSPSCYFSVRCLQD
jgi:uncharacterized protein (TIGR02145 family)